MDKTPFAVRFHHHRHKMLMDCNRASGSTIPLTDITVSWDAQLSSRRLTAAPRPLVIGGKSNTYR